MRVAVFHNLHSGGAKRVAAEHVARLALNNEVALFSLETADHIFASSAQVAQPLITRYRTLRLLKSPFGRLNPMLGLVDLVRMSNVSRRIAALIHASEAEVALVHPCQMTQAPYVLRWLRIPSLYYCHELPRRLYEPQADRPYLRPSPLRRTLDALDPVRAAYRLALRAADRANAMRSSRITANSMQTREDVGRVYGRKATVIAPGIDQAAFWRPAVTRQRFVLSVGALTPAKGFDFLIESLATLPVQNRPPLILISNYAEPEEQAFLQALATTKGVDLHIRVGVSETELREAYSSACCVAYAPIREPFGLVPLEAMAAGTPVVSVAEGGMRETIVHDVSGILTVREPQAFGGALAALALDPVRADRLGAASRDFALANFGWSQHLKRLESELQSLVPSRNEPRVG